MIRRSVPLALSLACVLAPAKVHAQADADRATARGLGEDGQAALSAHDYVRAEDDFRRADGLFHAPTLVLGLARAQAAQEEYVEAWESYHRIVLENRTDNPFFKKALEDAEAEIKTIEGKRCRITLFVEGVPARSAHVTLDGAPLRTEALGVERFADPGDHSVVASADGFETKTLKFHVNAGDTQGFHLSMVHAESTPAPTPAASDKPPLTRTLGFASFGVAGAALILGGVTGGLAIAKHSSIEGSCPNSTCNSTEAGAVSSYHTLGLLSDIGFIAAGAFAATGAVLVFTSRAPKETAEVRLWTTANAAGVSGTF